MAVIVCFNGDGGQVKAVGWHHASTFSRFFYCRDLCRRAAAQTIADDSFAVRRFTSNRSLWILCYALKLNTSLSFKCWVNGPLKGSQKSLKTVNVYGVWCIQPSLWEGMWDRDIERETLRERTRETHWEREHEISHWERARETLQIIPPSMSSIQ